MLNWTKSQVGTHLKGLLITNTLLKFQVVTTLSFKMAAQMPKFHALSVIQDQLRGSSMNLIPYVCVCVCARACVRACVPILFSLFSVPSSYPP